MFKLKQAYSDSGSGLGYQIGSYIMMRALEKRTGLKWGVDKNQFLALRHTFKDLPIHVIKEPKDIIRDSNIDYKTVVFDDEYGFNSIAEKLQDDTIIDTYPTVRNFVPSGDNGDLFLECKNELVFRDDIVEKCQKFIEPFGKDVISMHVRRGDFKNPQNGMFVCGTDYYENALEFDPGFYLAYFQLGVLQKKQGQSKKAIESLQKVIEIKPDHDKTWFTLGTAYEADGNNNEGGRTTPLGNRRYNSSEAREDAHTRVAELEGASTSLASK